MGIISKAISLLIGICPTMYTSNRLSMARLGHQKTHMQKK
jgi:hypothetical protein